MIKTKTLIIGAGAAGLMLANRLEHKNEDYLLLERNDLVGKKLLLTGNSRCNVTNNLSIDQFIHALTFKHKRFLYHALTHFNNKDIINFFETRGVPLKLEDNFKYFPQADRSKVIVDALLKGIDQKKIRYHQTVVDILDDDGYTVKTNDSLYKAKIIVIATGSKSFPHTGSTGDGIRFAKRFNLKTFPFTPAETVVYSKQAAQDFQEVQGTVLKAVSLKVASLNKPLTGDLLFTHFGLSGPLIMHASEFIYEALTVKKNTVYLSFLPLKQNELEEKLLVAKKVGLQLKDVLSPYFTKRFTAQLMHMLAPGITHLNTVSDKRLRKLSEDLLNYPITIDRVQDVNKAYVNKGGVDTKVINPKTMECKHYEGLYFIGETLDLHGPIGGFNLTIAFSTAVTAFESINQKK